MQVLQLDDGRSIVLCLCACRNENAPSTVVCNQSTFGLRLKGLCNSRVGLAASPLSYLNLGISTTVLTAKSSGLY